VIAGHAFQQNLRRGHYDLALDTPPATRLAAASTELAPGHLISRGRRLTMPSERTTQRRRSSHAAYTAVTQEV